MGLVQLLWTVRCQLQLILGLCFPHLSSGANNERAKVILLVKLPLTK
jgi:hypothetical protein